MIQQKEISNINELLQCQDTDIESVLQQDTSQKDKTSDLDYTIYYIVAISKVVFAADIKDDDKKEMLFRMISDFTESNSNIGNTLFELVPSAFLFQLLISLKNFGIDIEPLIRSVDLTIYENGLANLQILGDFTDQQFIDNLLLFYSKFNKHRYQKALHDIAIQAAKVNNVEACEKLIGKIKDGASKSDALFWLVSAYLRTGKTQKALEITEHSKDKAAIIAIISSFLLQNNQYQEALSLLKLNYDPEIKFEILISLIHYHIDHGTLKVMDVLIDEAIEQKDQIQDHFTQAYYSSKLAEIKMKLGRNKSMKMHISEVLGIVENELGFSFGCLAFNDLFTRLVIGEKYELADELLKKRWSNVNCTGQIEFNDNHTKDVSRTIQAILMRVDSIGSQSNAENKIEIMRLLACTLTSLMFLKNTETEDHLLHQIAISYAKNRSYGDAYFILKNINDQDYKNSLATMLPIFAVGNGDLKQALKLIDRIDIHQIKINVQMMLAPVFFKHGYYTEAMEFIKNWSLYKIHQNHF
ncbi:MAG: tetratricopeptide repeat protein [Bacteroidales bacterium]